MSVQRGFICLCAYMYAMQPEPDGAWEAAEESGEITHFYFPPHSKHQNLWNELDGLMFLHKRMG